MTFRIPSEDRRLAQLNSSDVNGNLYQTRNIDIDEEGYIKLSPGAVAVYTETNDADFNNVNSLFHGSEVFFVGSDLFRALPIGLAPAMYNVTGGDTTPPSPGPEEDGVYFNGSEVVTDVDTLKYNVSGTWTTIAGTPTASTAYPSPVCVFPNQNSLLFARGNKVARVNSSWAVAVTLTLPADYAVTSMDTNGNYAYIATRHIENGEAMMFIWTGVNTTNDGSYGAGTYEISSLRKYSSSVALVNSLGQLLQFNGSGFTELASLPVYFTRSSWADASNNNNNIGNRGMVVDGDLIYLNISTEVEDLDKRYLENMIGGIWCYDPKVGLYQKYSATNNAVLADTDVDAADINTTTDVITVSGITVPSTGSPVFYVDAGTKIGGLADESWYYTIYVSNTTFKLAKTYQDAIAGTAVDLTSTSDNNKFYFIKQNDYGMGVNESQGAVLVLNGDEYSTKEVGRVLFTSDVFPASGITTLWKAIVTSPKIRNVGYFVTPKMFAESLQDVFHNITLRFRPLNYGDKITVKYRKEERKGFPCLPRSQNSTDNLVTWTSSTVFTTPATPNTLWYDFSTVAIGDEVEVINGSGSGFISTVASISVSGYQYTVTIADANPFITASDTSMVKIDNWTTVEVINGTTFAGTQKDIPVDVSSGWVQFKVIMEGTGVAIYDNVVNSKSFQRPR